MREPGAGSVITGPWLLQMVSHDDNFSGACGLGGCAALQISSGGLTCVWLALIDGGLTCPQTSISSVPPLPP